MSIDSSTSKCIWLDITSTETIEKTIQPFWWYRSSSHMSDDIIQSYKNWDLDKHHQTTLECSFTISLENFHRFCRQFFWIIFIFFLDFIELWLKCSHTFLHVVTSKWLFDHKQSNSNRQKYDSNTQVTAKYSQKYRQDIKNRTIQNLCKQHSQHTNIFYLIKIFLNSLVLEWGNFFNSELCILITYS